MASSMGKWSLFLGFNPKKSVIQRSSLVKCVDALPNMCTQRTFSREGNPNGYRRLIPSTFPPYFLWSVFYKMAYDSAQINHLTWYICAPYKILKVKLVFWPRKKQSSPRFSSLGSLRSVDPRRKLRLGHWNCGDHSPRPRCEKNTAARTWKRLS